MTTMERLGGIVLSPTKTFADIDRRPSWVVPLLLLLLMNFEITFVVYRIMVTPANFDRIAQAKVHWDAEVSGKALSEQNSEQQVAALRRQRDRWYLFPPYAVVISTLGLSAFFYLVLRLAKAGTTFQKIFSVVSWSFLIYRGIGGVLTLIRIMLRGPEKFIPAPAEAWSPTSLAHLVPRALVTANQYSAISKLDIVLVWWLAVIAIGLAKTSSNLSLRKAVVIVGLSESVYLVLNAMGALPGVT
jgi:ABC-type Na+ efflux pump permease subunit